MALEKHWNHPDDNMMSGLSTIALYVQRSEPPGEHERGNGDLFSVVVVKIVVIITGVLLKSKHW